MTISYLHFLYVTLLQLQVRPFTDSLGVTISVSIDCGQDITNQATVTVVADYRVVPMVRCNDNYTYQLTTSDDVHYTGHANYAGDSASSCIFKKKQSIYIIEVLVGMVSHSGAWLRTWDSLHTVTCTFQNLGLDDSKVESIDESKAPVKLSMESLGGEIRSTLTLEIVDVLGEPITGTIPVGKTIRLHGKIMSENGETGLKAMNCEASNEVAFYPILIAGCGDGMVFSKTLGFSTRGLEVFSPYFMAFRLQGGTTMTYRCHFIACYAAEGCDGNSCDP